MDRIKRTGYWYIKKWDHPYSSKQGYIAEHRLIMEKFMGRYLKPYEIIHHINGIKTDNRIENLQIFINSGKHLQYHRPDLKEKQKILFKDKHFSPDTEWKKGDKRLVGNKFCVGRPPWNKGKKWSEEHKQRLKIAHKEKHKANKTSFKKGMIPWNKK